MHDPLYTDSYVGKLKKFFWTLTAVFFVAAVAGLFRMSIIEEWANASLRYAIVLLIIFTFVEAAVNEPDGYSDMNMPMPKENESAGNLRKIKHKAFLHILWLKVKVWGVAFVIAFGMHSCYMDQEAKEEERIRQQKERSERRTREAWESAAIQQAREDSIKRNMRYTIIKYSPDDSDDDNDEGYYDGLDDAEIDRETGAEYGTSYDDSGGGNDDYDDGYESGYDDEW